MSRRTPLTLAALLASVALVLALSACGSASRGGAAITVYSGQHEQTTAALVEGVRAPYGHSRWAVRSGDEPRLGNQILQEGANSPADVFYTENTPVLEALREKGAAGAVSPTTLAAIPSRYDSQQGNWVGVSARVSVLDYNTSLLSPSQLPDSLLALAAPKWKGKLGFAPSETDFQPLITAIIKLDGAGEGGTLAAGPAGQQQSSIPSNETVVAQVNNGESAIGPIDHYYWFRLRASSERAR